MFDDVLAERSRRPQVATTQILDLLGDVFQIQLVADRRQVAQQFGLLLGPGVKIFFVEGICRDAHH